MISGYRKKIYDLAAAATILLIAAVFVPFAVYLSGVCARGLIGLARESAVAAREMTVNIWPAEENTEPFTCLIFGIDTGEWVQGSYRPGPGRADTIVLIKAFPAEKKVSLLSIPRDTLMVIPGRPGEDKINHAYTYGQTPLLIETVELFTGVEIDYYLGLNYLAFRDIVDLLGGVEFEVDRVVESQGLRLEPGLQILDGEAAFAVVNTRDDRLGDIDRIKRQQRFIRAIYGEAKSRSFEENFFLMLAAWKHLDAGIDFTRALLLFRQLQNVREEDIAMALVPGWFYNRAGVSYWKPDPDETAKLVAELFLAPAGEGGAR